MSRYQFWQKNICIKKTSSRTNKSKRSRVNSEKDVIIYL